jgi:truncated hemoglobin YjbI
VLRENRRLRWSVEAKVLNSPNDISRYLGDLDNYLEGKGAPLATEAALGAYLISGKAEEVLASLETAMKTVFKHPPAFSERPHRTSDHLRDTSKLPASTPPEFLCHHLVFSLN